MILQPQARQQQDGASRSDRKLPHSRLRRLFVEGWLSPSSYASNHWEVAANMEDYRFGTNECSHTTFYVVYYQINEQQFHMNRRRSHDDQTIRTRSRQGHAEPRESRTDAVRLVAESVSGLRAWLQLLLCESVPDVPRQGGDRRVSTSYFHQGKCSRSAGRAASRLRAPPRPARRGRRAAHRADRDRHRDGPVPADRGESAADAGLSGGAGEIPRPDVRHDPVPARAAGSGRAARRGPDGDQHQRQYAGRRRREEAGARLAASRRPPARRTARRRTRAFPSASSSRRFCRCSPTPRRRSTRCSRRRRRRAPASP